MIIYNSSGIQVFDTPINEGGVYHCSLMNEEYVHLNFSINKLILFTEGMYIVYNGENYQLTAPYIPERINEDEYKYELQFLSPRQLWRKILLFYMFQESTGRESNFEITDSIDNIGIIIANNLEVATGIRYTIKYDATLTDTKNFSFQSASIFDALTKVANEWNTEWWVSGTTINFSHASQGTPKELIVGTNINVPDVIEPADGYYTRYYIYGSTRNIDQSYDTGGLTNHLVTKRLVLPASSHPNNFIDIRDGLATNEILTTELVFEDIYPRSILAVSDVRMNTRDSLDDNSNRIEIGQDSNGNPIYQQDISWVFKLPQFDFNIDMVLNGFTTPSVRFTSGRLNGWDFVLNYYPDDSAASSDSPLWYYKAGEFEIVPDTSTGITIPDILSLIPINGDTLSMYNIQMPDEYVEAAEIELLEAAKTEIERLHSNRNEYSFTSNPVWFDNNSFDLNVGDAVLYKDGDIELSTRVLSIEKKLDFPIEQDITIGEERSVSRNEELRTEVAQVNQSVSSLISFSEIASSITNQFSASMSEIRQTLSRMGNLWQFTDDAHTAITSPFPVKTPMGLSVTGDFLVNSTKYSLNSFDVSEFLSLFIINRNTDGSIKNVGIKNTFFSLGGISALGYSDNGGGGGTPIVSGYLYELYDVNSNITSAPVGSALIKGSDGLWTYGSLASELTFTQAGTGNIVSGVVRSGNVVTVTKGLSIYAWAQSAVKPSYTFADILSTPTTLAGYGITDALGISSNAVSATKLATARTIALTGATTGSGTFDGSVNLSISTINAYLTVMDTRSVVDTPETFATRGLYADFKYNSANSLSDGGTFNGVLTFRKYGSATDWSGGNALQVGYTQNSNIWARFGSGTAWGSWRRLAYIDEVLPLTGGTISGNLIVTGLITGALSGNATTATTLQTARTLTIGNTGKTFNGSANVVWTLAEIGALGSGANAVSATQLATARTIWGQSFNGTANVSGALSGATTINASGNVTIGGLFFTNNKTGGYDGISGTMIDGDGHIFLTTSGTIQGGILGMYGGATNYTHLLYFGSNNEWFLYGHIKPTSTNTFSNGTISYRWSNLYSVLLNISGAATLSSTLDVSGITVLGSTLSVTGAATFSNMTTTTGIAYHNSHVYVSGTNALYFNTYGGGWNMTDTYFIRSYGTKTIYASSTNAFGVSSFNVGLSLYGASHQGLELFGGTTCVGIGSHSNGKGHIWFGTGTSNTSSTNKSYIAYFNATGFEILQTTDATVSTDTGALRVAGGIYAVKSIFVGANVRAVGYITADNRIYTGYDPGSGYVGSISCSNWFRSNGSTGWFNGTYTTGIYSNTANIVRLYSTNSFQVYNVTDATAPTTTTASIYTAGGIAVAKSIYAGGNVVAYGGITALQTSDMRYKNSLGDFDALEMLRILPYFQFTWKDNALQLNETFTSFVQYGTSAQAVKTILPDFVTEIRDVLTLNYNKFIPILMKATIEVDDRVTLLEKKVKQLEYKLSKYEQ